MKTFKGLLESFFETGCEGQIWIVCEDGYTGYDSVRIIEQGDNLTILDASNNIIFQGIIDEDTVSGWTEHYPSAGHGQPVALGLWIHWTQKGFTPDIWASFFFHKPPYTAILVKP